MSAIKTFLGKIFEECVRSAFKLFFRLVFRIKIQGLENVPKQPGKLVIIANHANIFDGLIIWAYLGLKFKAIANRNRAKEFLYKPFMQNQYTVLLDSLNPFGFKNVVNMVNNGTPLLIFPEGRMTRTGSLMKIYEGAGFVAYKTGAKILPIHLQNTYAGIFSKNRKRGKLFAPITMTIGKICDPIEVDQYPPRQRKKQAAKVIYQILCNQYYEVHTVPAALGPEYIRLCRENGPRTLFKDMTGKEVSYRKALTGMFVLGNYFKKYPDQNIGILLPNLTVTALLFMGLQIFRKVPVFLNYAAGPAALQKAMELADLEVIVTSTAFLEKIKIKPAVLENKKLVFLEGLKTQIGLKDKLLGLWRSRFPGDYGRMEKNEHKGTAVVLFTSGSEGVPKGVCLSHENIIANIHQALAKVDFREEDYLLNALPIFHSFGLTIGTILPLFAHAKVYLYVSPLHYRTIPELVYDEECTILLGTNTFLNGFSKRAHPYDFHSIRYIFCGAEGLSEAVFEKYAKIFGARILTGYGATECSPIISINNALEPEHGSVGRLLPGIRSKLVPVEGVDPKNGQVGLLYVKGKNVMKGYLKNTEANYKYLVRDQGWYDTGDIVEMTEEGFLKIMGRVKRFAKISGEMISLTAVEEALAAQVDEKKQLAVMAVADERKGEKLVLATNHPQLDLKTIREFLKAKGFSDLACPREIKYLPGIPRLGTGKVDYVGLKQLMQLGGEQRA